MAVGLHNGLQETEETPILVSITEGSGPRLSSNVKTLGNIIVSIVGAGVLGLPYTFKESGWLLGSVAVLAIALLSYYCMMKLVHMRQKLFQDGHTNIRTYGDLGAHVYGAWGSFAVDVMVILSQGCFCIGYLIFITENLKSVFNQSRALFAGVILVLQLFLAAVKSLTGLAPFSIFADVTEVLAMALVVNADFHSFKGFDKVHAVGSLSSLPFVIGVSIYAFEGFPLTLPLEAVMADKARFPQVLALAIGGITAVYVVFGAMGYLAFGEATKDIVTLNLPGGWLTTSVKLALCLGLFFTFPVMMYPCHEIIELRVRGTAFFRHNILPSPRLVEVLFFMLRVVAVVVACFVAVVIPGFNVFMSVVGATVCSILAFSLPALFHMHVMRGKLARSDLIINLLLVFFGASFTVWGTTTAIINAIH